MARSKRRDIKNALAQVYSFIAPVRRLPDDILFLIFQELQDEMRTSLLQLMLVCRKWHGVVSGHPALWTYISIPERDFEYGRRPSTKRILTYLTRSREALLDIVIDLPSDHQLHDRCRNEGWDGEDDDHDESSCDKVDAVYRELRPLLDILVGIGGCHMKRWKSFSFLHHSSRPLKTHCDLRVLQYPAPQLQTLVLYEWDPEHSFGETPRLSRLALQGYNGLVSLGPATSAITELIVELVTCSELDALFQLLSSLCHQLKVFRVCSVWRVQGQLQRTPKPRLSLPSLQVLEVDMGTIFDYVLASLDLPNLINIHISPSGGAWYHKPQPMPQTPWTTWFQRIRCLVIQLPDTYGHRELDALLGEAQGVEILTVSPSIRRSVEITLANDLALCPMLQQLRVLSYTTDSYTIPLSHTARSFAIPFYTRQTS